MWTFQPFIGLKITRIQMPSFWDKRDLVIFFPTILSKRQVFDGPLDFLNSLNHHSMTVKKAALMSMSRKCISPPRRIGPPSNWPSQASPNQRPCWNQQKDAMPWTDGAQSPWRSGLMPRNIRNWDILSSLFLQWGRLCVGERQLGAIVWTSRGPIPEDMEIPSTLPTSTS